MCIEGTPSNVFELSPRKGKLGWRKFDSSPDGTVLRPVYAPGSALDTWRTKLAKAHARPTGKYCSDIGLHAWKRPRRAYIVGRVRLFGRVVEHRSGGRVTGYLAEYAELVGLSARWSVAGISDLAATYGVNVLR